VRFERAAPLLAGLLASGCALLSRGTPLKPHYYDPAPPQSIVAARAAPPTCVLKLGDIDADDGLGQDIAFRRSPYEVGFYQTRRWSESPDNYLRRALVRGLFDDQRCRRILSGDGPTLDARLTAFEERRGEPQQARVAVHVVLHDEHGVRAETTFEAARPFVTGDRGDAEFEPFVAAVAQALDDVIGDVVALVVSAEASAPRLSAGGYE
jgi:cholesterol transport system auxiliary component